MTEEFNLSEKEQMKQIFGESIFYFKREDVKEFIRLFKEILLNNYDYENFSEVTRNSIFEDIDKLAGDKLI